MSVLLLASGEDPQCSTPKVRKGDMMYNQGGHMTPNASNASPHPHEDFEMGSPTNWPRTPASPVFNTHIAAPPPPPETSSYRSSKVKVS